MVRKWDRSYDLFYTFNGVKWVYIVEYEKLKNIFFEWYGIDTNKLSDDELLMWYERYEDELTLHYEDEAEEEFRNE